MTKHSTVGIDVGTFQIKVIIAESGDPKAGPKTRAALPTIIGSGFSQSKGLRHGYIINQGDVARSIRAAVSQAEKAAGFKVRRAYLSVGGVGLDEVRGRGETIISRADSEVTDLDIKRAIDNSEERVSPMIVNKKIINTIPLSFVLDGQKVLGRPQGMKGNKLEVETLFITTLEQHLHDLIATIEEIGISVTDVMASPIAASFVTLSKAQKIAGCVLANIGAETVSIAVFENNIPISLKTFPIGSTDITNDIALGFKVSLDEAEHLKRGAVSGGTHSKKKLDEIISARLSDIFELIDAHLKKIGKSGLLPAGIILTGGGSSSGGVEDLARSSLKIPSKSIALETPQGGVRIKDSSWAVAYGLTIWGMSDKEDSSLSGVGPARETFVSIGKWLKQFLP